MKEILKEILKEIIDEANHIVGTEADYHKEVAIQDAKNILRLANLALKELKKESFLLDNL